MVCAAAAVEDLPAFTCVEVCPAGFRMLWEVLLCSTLRHFRPEFVLVAFATVRDGRAGALVCLHRGHRRPADPVFGAGQVPRLAGVSITVQRTARGADSEWGVSLMAARRLEVVDDAAGLGTPNSGASCRSVRFTRR